VSFEDGHCTVCGTLRDTALTHMITGEENYLHHTLASIGVPPLHILRANNGEEYRFYELSGDLSESLHFNHFVKSAESTPSPVKGRIRFKSEVQPLDTTHIKVRAHVKLHN
jgi:hypothetical protein